MTKRAMLALLSILIVTVLGATPADAASRKPGLYGPEEVTAGQKVTFRSVFLAKDRKDSCFEPDIDWGDAPPSTGLSMSGCMKFGSSGQYKREVNTFTHVFAEPGTYRVTVRAAGVPSSGLSFGEDAPVTVKGPKRYTRTIVVRPGATPSPTATPSPSATAEVAS